MTIYDLLNRRLYRVSTGGEVSFFPAFLNHIINVAVVKIPIREFFVDPQTWVEAFTHESRTSANIVGALLSRISVFPF